MMRFVGRLGEDALELVGALGRVVGRAGHVGDLLERLVVDAAPEPAAATAAAEPATPEPVARLAAPELRRAGRVELAAVRRPEADRVDADAARRRLLRGLERIRAEVAGAVGQRDDDVRRVRAGRDRRRLDARAAVAGARLDRRVDLGDGVDGGQDAAADRRPAAGRQAAQRG